MEERLAATHSSSKTRLHYAFNSSLLDETWEAVHGFVPRRLHPDPPRHIDTQQSADGSLKPSPGVCQAVDVQNMVIPAFKGTSKQNDDQTKETPTDPSHAVGETVPIPPSTGEDSEQKQYTQIKEWMDKQRARDIIDNRDFASVAAVVWEKMGKHVMRADLGKRVDISVRKSNIPRNYDAGNSSAVDHGDVGRIGAAVDSATAIPQDPHLGPANPDPLHLERNARRVFPHLDEQNQNDRLVLERRRHVVEGWVDAQRERALQLEELRRILLDGWRGAGLNSEGMGQVGAPVAQEKSAEPSGDGEEVEKRAEDELELLDAPSGITDQPIVSSDPIILPDLPSKQEHPDTAAQSDTTSRQPPSHSSASDYPLSLAVDSDADEQESAGLHPARKHRPRGRNRGRGPKSREEVVDVAGDAREWEVQEREERPAEVGADHGSSSGIDVARLVRATEPNGGTTSFVDRFSAEGSAVIVLNDIAELAVTPQIPSPSVFFFDAHPPPGAPWTYRDPSLEGGNDSSASEDGVEHRTGKGAVGLDMELTPSEHSEYRHSRRYSQPVVVELPPKSPNKPIVVRLPPRSPNKPIVVRLPPKSPNKTYEVDSVVRPALPGDEPRKQSPPQFWDSDAIYMSADDGGDDEYWSAEDESDFDTRSLRGGDGRVLSVIAEETSSYTTANMEAAAQPHASPCVRPGFSSEEASDPANPNPLQPRSPKKRTSSEPFVGFFSSAIREQIDLRLAKLAGNTREEIATDISEYLDARSEASRSYALNYLAERIFLHALALPHAISPYASFCSILRDRLAEREAKSSHSGFGSTPIPMSEAFEDALMKASRGAFIYSSSGPSNVPETDGVTDMSTWQQFVYQLHLCNLIPSSARTEGIRVVVDSALPISEDDIQSLCHLLMARGTRVAEGIQPFAGILQRGLAILRNYEPGTSLSGITDAMVAAVLEEYAGE